VAAATGAVVLVAAGGGVAVASPPQADKSILAVTPMTSKRLNRSFFAMSFLH
jgi:hypothetical protein